MVDYCKRGRISGAITLTSSTLRLNLNQKGKGNKICFLINIEPIIFWNKSEIHPRDLSFYLITCFKTNPEVIWARVLVSIIQNTAVSWKYIYRALSNSRKHIQQKKKRTSSLIGRLKNDKRLGYDIRNGTSFSADLEVLTGVKKFIFFRPKKLRMFPRTFPYPKEGFWTSPEDSNPLQYLDVLFSRNLDNSP